MRRVLQLHDILFLSFVFLPFIQVLVSQIRGKSRDAILQTEAREAATDGCFVEVVAKSRPILASGKHATRVDARSSSVRAVLGIQALFLFRTRECFGEALLEVL